MSAAFSVLLMLLAVLAIPFGIVALIYLIVPGCRAVVWLVRQVVRFVVGMVSDTLRVIGALITSLVLIPLVIGNVALGRWSASAHFGRAIQAEVHAALRCLYRVLIGHPARLLCLTPLTEGLEKRIPEAVAAAPGADRPRGRANQFDGYTIVGSLPGGGSGSRLYVADPGPQKRAAFERAGLADVDQVVIKSFSLREGSSLPQIVRESRALDAAKRLGLILEHELTADRFYYVMRYVPGDPLGLVTQRLHAAGSSAGLTDRDLREALGYACDLLRTLCHYHAGGLWHKDVKPDNIIVAHGRAHLVDFGLVTPLRSAMTLTTHGTEYFRDPEMVRMALKGVKVHQVDGARFDVYAAGAVLYSVIENSFPAHGGLSHISKRCPEALRWIVRRAMTDYDKRYESAAAMLADLEALLAAPDLFAMKPADLPSVGGALRDHDSGPVQESSPSSPEPAPAYAAGPASYTPPPRLAGPRPAPAYAPERTRPNIRVVSWWTGRYAVDAAPARAPFVPPVPPAPPPPPPPPPPPGPFVRRTSAPAADQLRSARERVHAARSRARERMRRRDRKHVAGINGGVAAALFAFLAVSAGFVALVYAFATDRVSTPTVVVDRSARTSRAAARLADAADEFAARVRDLDARARGVSASASISISTDAPAAPWLASSPRVLVIREPFTLDPAVAPIVNDQLAHLRAAGFELLGSTDRAPADPDEQARQDALVADLRAAVGVLPFLSTEAGDRIRQWLAAHDDLPLVLWIGRGDGETPQSWIISRREIDPRLPALAHDALVVRK